MTRISEQELMATLKGNPDIRCAETVLRLPESEGPLRYRAAHSIGAPVPDEDQEQAVVIAWAAAHEGKWPELEFLYHVPNGGSRDKATGAMLKRTGVKAGVLDLNLPVARGGFHGLWIEMKKCDHSNHPSAKQKRWIDVLRREGHRVEVCYGAEEAIDVLQDYLKSEK